MNDMIRGLVHEAYWRDDVNCATTMLRVLATVHGVELAPQVLAAATGMHGAGGAGAQCGLVEGGLMFVGVWGRTLGRPDGWIVDRCREYGRTFEARFGSLLCRVLRPQGFVPNQPPHLCQELTEKAALWAATWTGTLD